MAECFYCGTDEKLTRAHIFQQRIRQALPNESFEVTLGLSSVSSKGVARDILYRGDVREMHVKNLCIYCNSRWMEPIEQAAGPVLNSILEGRGFPPPSDLFRLAHWSTIAGALATQTGGRFEMPVAHRRDIRFTATGQPLDFGTHFIWTSDNYPSVKFDFMRFEIGGDENEPKVSWYSALHAGPVVIISAEFTVNTMIARELHLSGIQSYLGTVSSNLLCIPDAIRTGQRSPDGLVTPTHHAVQEMYRTVVGRDVTYIDTRGGSLVSIEEKRWRRPEGFEYGDTLVDMRSRLDLSYLDGVFES